MFTGRGWYTCLVTVLWRQRQRERQRGREAERQRGREAERQRGREAERQRGREAERQRGRGRGRQISEFEASLVYRVSSRTARAIQ
jgi:membrane protein involved in colicin uptake